MLERETEQIVGVVTQKTIGQAPSISLREVLAADILPALKSFFRTDVEAMFLEEHNAALGRSKFNHEHPDVKHAHSQLRSVMVMHYVFGRKEYLARLADAVQLLANYLVRPQWTLTGVVFEKEPAITVESLRRLMQYFAPYEYLGEVLFRYAEDRKLSAFTKDDFSTLLWKIDAAFVRRKTGQELCEALAPMYEFFDYPRNSGKFAMPVKALIKYFEDKGLTDAQTRLEGEMAQGLSSVPLQSLSGILEDVRRATGQFVVERNEPKPGATGDPGAPDAAAADAAAPPPPAGDAARQADHPGHRPGPDIASAIQENEKRKFVRKIFRQEDSKFDEAIQQLGRTAGWKEASKLIDEIFIENDVDPYSGEAERFIEIVFQQYHPPR